METMELLYFEKEAIVKLKYTEIAYSDHLVYGCPTINQFIEQF